MSHTLSDLSVGDFGHTVGGNYDLLLSEGEGRRRVYSKTTGLDLVSVLRRSFPQNLYTKGPNVEDTMSSFTPSPTFINGLPFISLVFYRSWMSTTLSIGGSTGSYCTRRTISV